MWDCCWLQKHKLMLLIKMALHPCVQQLLRDIPSKCNVKILLWSHYSLIITFLAILALNYHVLQVLNLLLIYWDWNFKPVGNFDLLMHFACNCTKTGSMGAMTLNFLTFVVLCPELPLVLGFALTLFEGELWLTTYWNKSEHLSEYSYVQYIVMYFEINVAAFCIVWALHLDMFRNRKLCTYFQHAFKS